MSSMWRRRALRIFWADWLRTLSQAWQLTPNPRAKPKSGAMKNALDQESFVL